MSGYDLQWSEWSRIDTANGVKRVRTAPATTGFWVDWRANKEALEATGLSIRQDWLGKWQVVHTAELSKEELAENEEAFGKSYKGDCDYYPPCPKGLAYLPFQRAAIQYGLQRLCEKGFLIADPCGSGKTIEAIGYINATFSQSILVVCPAIVKLVWEEELKKWLTRKLTIGVLNGRTSEIPDTDIVIMNYELLASYPQLAERKWDLIIGDEIQWCRNPQSGRTQHFKYLDAKEYILITYTPIVNRPIELFVPCQILDPDGLGKSMSEFGKRYCKPTKVRGGWEYKGADNLDELQQKLRSRFMVRRAKSEILSELPPKFHQIVTVSAGRKGKSLVTQELDAYNARELARTRLKDIREDVSGLNETAHLEAMEALRGDLRVAMSALAAARQEIALAKLPHIVELSRDAEANGQPHVIFCHHLELIKQLTETFEDSGVISGKTPQKKRKKIIDDFQRGVTNRLILSIQAAGIGITATRAQRVIMGELPWTPAEVTQCIERVHRIGTKTSILIQYPVLENSLDGRMARTLVKKQRIYDAALGGEHEIPTN